MRTWIDESYGVYGYKLWLYLISWIGLFYILNFLFGDAFRMIFVEKNHSFPRGIYFALVAIYIILFWGGLLFLLESKKIARKIISNKMNYCVQFFLWGKLQFSTNEVKNIEIYNPKGFQRQATPLKLNRNNFRVNLQNGSFFYISGLMEGVDSLINEIKSD